MGDYSGMPAAKAETKTELDAAIERAKRAEVTIEQAKDVYRRFFAESQVGHDSYREFLGKLQTELFEALHGTPRSDSIWLSEISPEQHRAESPHYPCGKEEDHDGHVWRGSRREFHGACEVTRTYWCEGVTPEAEPEPGTYWERAVLERFVMGGPVDMKTVRQQVAALLADIPRRSSRPTEGSEDRV